MLKVVGMPSTHNVYTGKCMSAHMQTHPCIHRQVHVCTHANTPMYTQASACLHTCKNTEAHTCKHKQVHVHTHAKTHTCTHVNTSKCMSAHMQTHTHTSIIISTIVIILPCGRRPNLAPSPVNSESTPSVDRRESSVCRIRLALSVRPWPCLEPFTQTRKKVTDLQV